MLLEVRLSAPVLCAASEKRLKVTNLDEFLYPLLPPKKRFEHYVTAEVPRRGKVQWHGTERALRMCFTVVQVLVH